MQVDKGTLTYVRLHTHNQDKWVYTLFGDILPFWPHWLVACSLLFVYFMITFFLDVPGCGRGYLGPGNLIPSRTGVIVRVWFLTAQCVALKVALATTANISTARAELRATSTRRSSPRTTSTTSPRASVRLVFC
jgi:hypothetical protein